ncbi:MAG: carboxypeptidase-like regulatory domain-containing protein [Holophaga sp.]|nr:carboxypeptidase-like regulatory domain-containing protein [Holophaga sp.]
MVRLLFTWMLCLSALAGTVGGRITDGRQGLAGVLVYPDRLVRVRSRDLPPEAVTDADGRFSLDLAPGDTVLAVEKSGWQRDLVPLADLAAPVALRPAAAFGRERVLALRLDLPGIPQLRSDAELRAILFSRRPGEASAANYYYEISKGSLELAEGAMLHLAHSGAVGPAHPRPPRFLVDERRGELVDWTLNRVKGMDLKPYDQVNNRTGAGGADGKPDHLWIIPPGPSRTVTLDPAHFAAICFLQPLPWNPARLWPVVFFAEETPLGNIVHEGIHAMGEQRVGDLYMDNVHPLTAGRWDIMDAGQFQGWDREHPFEPLWQEDTGYSPAQPMGWIRGDMWYSGRFRDTVTTLRLAGAWEGWMDPLERAPRDLPQRLVLADPRGRGRFWEFNVRRPWGFDRGRTGDRWGPGYEGLVVARVDPGRMAQVRGTTVTHMFQGPVRVLNAHPEIKEPPVPRYPWGRWQLDGAAYNLGAGEVAAGRDGPLSWEVLAVDASGRMKVRVSLAASK